MPQPKFLDDPAYKSLRIGDLAAFAQHTSDRKQVDFSDTDLRGVDFRGVDLKKVMLRGAYLRDADLRGLDLRDVDLEGCSLYHAKISGAYFPTRFTAQEITASVQLGTRMRAST